MKKKEKERNGIQKISDTQLKKYAQKGKPIFLSMMILFREHCYISGANINLEIKILKYPREKSRNNYKII